MARSKRKAKRHLAALSKSLRAKIGLSGLALNVERLARAFWPAIMLGLTIFSLLIWQAHLLLPTPYDLGLYATLSGAFLWLLWKGIRAFSPATRDQAILRLDANAKGNPVISLVDRQLSGVDDADAQELWQLHQKRMAAEAEKVDVPAPHVRLSKRDPWALRLVTLLFFGSAVFFGQANRGQSLTETLQDLASGTGGEVASFEAWAEPPAYTGFPAIYLNTLEEGKPLELPVGTRLILRSYGATELEIISDVATLTDEQKILTDERSFKITETGTVSLKKGYRTVALWDITVIPDTPPSVELTDEISRTVQGSIQIPYAAKDDYGIIGGTVLVTLDMDNLVRRYGLELEPENTDPIRFELPLPFNADTSDFTDTAVEDLSQHPWSGLPVKISLSVQDAAGNEAVTAPVFMPMPGKRFFDTLAAALVEQRRDILWNRGNIDRVQMILKTLSYLPEDGFPNPKAYLMVRSVIRRIGYTDERPIKDAMVADIAKTLWRAALLIEDGDLSDAAARLKRAQERLSEAMKNGATDAEIAELMEELRKATKDYMRQLAQNAKPQDEQATNQNIQQVTPSMIQEMMDKIQELMEQGRMAEAQELLDQLQQMLENLQVTQGGSGGDQEQSGGESMQDTLREQQDLADENFQEMQEKFNRNQDAQNQEGQQQGQNEGGEQKSGSGSDLAERQEALRELMQQQMDGLAPDDSEAGQAAREALREAERQMGQARDNLEQGRGVEALDNQADAVEALRQGMQRLNEANQQAGGGQNREGQKNGETAGPNRQDPLGRSTARRGAAQSNQKLLQSDEQLRRSKEILKEIRRRSGERSRPQLELDYLDRLLDRF
ncbi:MAG: TIGR02302 family protein [Amylibacter sp.]|nr:TIGR02302 family protein [Amylibacter sp.]